MKTIQKISALLAASATLSMAGVINVYTGDAKKASASLNLTTIDSLTFSGKAEKKEMSFSGKTKQKAIKLTDIDHVDFKLKDKSKETMTVTVGEGIKEGARTFNLSEIKKIEIVEMDSEEDMDEDGLTDLNEIYKYDTNPKSADTDGDGWSDKEELADGMYSPSNPTKFNPRIADVPGLSVTLKKSPSITLNITTSEGKTESESITEGREVSKTSSTTYEQTRSADLMNAWEFSTTHGWEVGGDLIESKYVGSITVGYNGSYTSSTGMTWGGSEENSVTQSFEKAVAKEKSEGSEINGATLCMQVEVKNSSDIAFTIEDLTVSASTYDIKDTSTLKILAELTRESGASVFTLKPNESTQMNFCNKEVAVEKIKNLIYNTSSIVLGSSAKKLTIDRDNCSDVCDFSSIYTKVAAKTADITIDYGPGSTGNSSARYQVAVNYRYNLDHKGTDDQYAQTSLAELLRNAHVNFKQDTVVGPEKKKFYGLASIDGYKFNLADSAMWFVTIQRAADIKKGLNTVDIYSLCIGSYDLEKVFVGAGDAVHIFYSKDQDNDGVPLSTEHQFATSDTTVDTDEDGITDYDEITGWIQEGDSVKIYTNPTDPDTDGDGLNDKEDPEPTRRPLFKDASLFKLQIFADSLMKNSAAVESKDSTDLAKNNDFNVTVQAPIAYFKVIPNAKKVAWVKVKTDNGIQEVQPNANGIYSFHTLGQLTVSKDTRVEIQVCSEDNKTIKRYTIYISSPLAPPTNLLLGKTADRENILVNYERSMDTRVKGYVILRGDQNAKLPETIKEGTSIKDNGTYNGFKVFTVDATANSKTDGVGKGSPYYTYRVYAYSKDAREGKDSIMVFSKGTDQHTRSVGRIKVEFKMTDFGGEYLLWGVNRVDIKGEATLYEGSNNSGTKLGKTMEAFDWMAGDDDGGNTIYYFGNGNFDEGDDKAPADENQEADIGSAGLYLNLYIKGSATNHNPDVAEHGIRWSYGDMVRVLNGETSVATGLSGDGNAPKRGNPSKPLAESNGGVEYLVGMDGIEYNDDNNKCSKDCGDEPHAGFWFAFKYDWVGDADFY